MEITNVKICIIVTTYFYWISNEACKKCAECACFLYSVVLAMSESTLSPSWNTYNRESDKHEKGKEEEIVEICWKTVS